MTANDILKLKGKRSISALTAYDYPTARLLDEAGTDILLVGDSLGMVVLGFPDTTHVTLEHIIHHLSAARRGTKNALLVGDLPIGTYDTPSKALDTARRLQDAGADAVKLEGGIRQAEKVHSIISNGIPVMGHLGMLPQRVKEEGGYKKKGKSNDEISNLNLGAKALIEAGVFSIVLESVVAEIAEETSSTISVPTIGIGSGKGTCDGEIAVITDLIGSYPWFVPPFATPKANISEAITKAVREWIEEQRNLRD